MLHKSFELLETKAEGDHGEFTAIVSTFGNVDRVGDRIMPGAWTKTLEKWSASGDPIPIILAHQWNDVFAHVGVAEPQNVKQVEQGLQVTGKLDVEDNPVAKQVYKLMKRRSLKEFSIGYDVPAGGEKRAKDGANEISQINLAECGPCLVGIDPKTELQSVKSALGIDPPDAETLRKETARVEREAVEDRLPELKEPVPEFPPEPLPPEPEPTPELPDPEAQRKEAERIAREQVESKFPEVPPVPKPEEPDLAKELQELKERLAFTEQALEILVKKVEEADKEPERVRSVDPLRRQADAVALEFATDGLPHKPPTRVEQPKPEPELSLTALKQRMRDEMLMHLSGETI